MLRLLDIGLANALTAAVMALLVGAASPLLRRRPAVLHALWLLVLLKLLTPPLWRMPVQWTAPAPREAAEVIVVWDEMEVEPADAHAAADATTSPVTPPQPARRSMDWRAVIARVAAVVWLIGSALCAAVAVFRTVQFARALRTASPAPPDVQRQAAAVAARLGVRKCPPVWLVPAPVCPMLWALGGDKRLLLPQALWGRLSETQRDTLFAHELAHLRRRDHWVRLVESAATVLYWWHPALWWARRGLREAEEQCCDAWVVWSMPAAARHYMSAILEAVEFVSDPFVSEPQSKLSGGVTAARPVLPALASGMGEFRRLERRLSMIRQNNNPPRLGRAAFLVVCALGAAALPLAPAMGVQEEGTDEHRAVIVTEAPADGQTFAVEVVAEDAPATDPKPIETFVGEAGSLVMSPDGKRVVVKDGPVVRQIDATTGKIISETHTDQFVFAENDEVAQARAEVARLTEALEAANRRLAALEGRSGKKETPRLRTVTVKPKAPAKLDAKDATSYRVTTKRKEPAKGWTVKQGDMDPKSSKGSQTEWKVDEWKVDKSNPKEVGDDRINKLEDKLDRLERLLEQMRDSQQNNRDGRNPVLNYQRPL